MTQYEQSFYQALKAKRQRMGAGNRKKSFHSPTPRWIYPWSVEKNYADFLRQIFSSVTDYVTGQLDPILKEYLKADSAHIDAGVPKAFQTVMQSLAGWIAIHFPNKADGQAASLLLMGLGEEADKTNGFNKQQWNKFTKSALGFEFGTPESWYPDMKEAWANRNYDLIVSSVRAYTGQINDIIEQAVVNGWSVNTAKTMIRKLDESITGAKARLLARDQIGKLNGMMTKTRQQEVGINTYRWRTAGDERVRGRPGGKYAGARPSHWAMEGLLCSWDDSSVYSKDGGKTWIPRPAGAILLHPGMDIQCRCGAEGNYDDIFNQIDQEMGDAVKNPIM